MSAGHEQRRKHAGGTLQDLNAVAGQHTRQALAQVHALLASNSPAAVGPRPKVGRGAGPWESAFTGKNERRALADLHASLAVYKAGRKVRCTHRLSVTVDLEVALPLAIANGGSCRPRVLANVNGERWQTFGSQNATQNVEEALLGGCC